jgi:hypothetical protein
VRQRRTMQVMRILRYPELTVVKSRRCAREGVCPNERIVTRRDAAHDLGS